MLTRVLVEPDSNDFYLLPFSPCIDAGDPNSEFGLEPKPDGDGIVNFLDFAELAENWQI